MTLADLSPRDRATAIDGFITDVMLVLGHVIRSRIYPACIGYQPTASDLHTSIYRREVPSLPVLFTISAWTLRELARRERFHKKYPDEFRPLTAADRTLRDAAQRIANAIDAWQLAHETHH